MTAEPTSENSDAARMRASRSAPIIERAPLPIVEVEGAAHLVSYVNSAFCRLLGTTKSELVGKPFAEIVPGGDECVPILDRVYETGEAATHAHEIGSEAPPAFWLYAMWPALDATERPVGVIIQLTQAAGFRQNLAEINAALLISGLRQHELTAEALALNEQLAKEIAERKLAEAALNDANRQLGDQAGELERLVAERTKKLRETVGELEGFSYSVAHDMRAPLRGMQGFARILLDDYSRQLPPKAQTYLEHIASSAARMDLLIRDVLNYTQVLSGEVKITPVDLNRVVREIVATYPGWQSPRVEIQIEEPLPVVLGHEGFLTQCISNLLTNAVKFVPDGVTPRVRIWAEERAPTLTSPAPQPSAIESGSEERWDDRLVVRLWFEDNGIGIAPENHNRIFQMFERINPAEQFEGTGVGLTIVRKALQRMNGRIDFESEPGKGSRFWIELSKAPDRPA
jgi:signal transduction histidine kinase